VYSSLDRAYRDDISGSDSEKRLMTVASIVQRLHRRLMPLLDNHHTSSLTYRPCWKRLNLEKKPFNARFSILDHEQTLQLCGNASCSRLEVAIRTCPHPEKRCIICWWLMLSPPCGPSATNYMTSAKNISIRAEWLRQGGCAPSEPSETHRWQTTPRPAPIGCVTLHIALRSQFRRFVSLCQYPIVNDHRGVVANCAHTSGWVHWVRQQNVYRSRSHMQGSISTRHFAYHIRLCYSHKIRYLII